MEKDFIIAGFGGQGVLLAGEVLANGFMLNDDSWCINISATILII